MEEGKKVFVDFCAWSIADTETAGTVTSGKVELKIRLKWIFARCIFFGSSIPLFVHTIDPDDGPSSRGQLSQQAWERVDECSCRNSVWTNEILLQVDEEEGRHFMREETCQRTHCIRRVLWVDLTFMTHVLNDHVIFGRITRMLDN